MKKTFLLAKSNFRKTKGLSIGLSILIFLAFCFLNVVLMIGLDFNQNALNTAKDLNAEDVYTTITGDVDVSDQYLESLFDKNQVKDYEFTRFLSTTLEIPFNKGVTLIGVAFAPENERGTHINRSELMKEDTSITKDYVYLPYQIHTTGGINLGDDFPLEIQSKTYNFKVKGFFNIMTLGSNNAGTYMMYLDDASYQKIATAADGAFDTIYAKFQVKNDVNSNKFINAFNAAYTKDHPTASTFSLTLDDVIFARTFLGSIFSAILIALCVIVLLIVILMLANNLSNFIRENMRSLGALKALGYTSRDISNSFIIQFVTIGLIGSAAGSAISVVLMQVIGNIMAAQSGIPYTATFNPISSVVTLVALLLIIVISLAVLLRRIKKIEPIVALREGASAGHRKINSFKIETTHLPINLIMSLKTMLSNLGQNAVTFLVVFGLIYMNTLGLVLLQNFCIEPKLSILTFEITDGIVNTDADEDRSIKSYLETLEGVKNPHMVVFANLDIDDAHMVSYVVDDTSKINNKDTIYEGRFPTDSNEVAISGKFGESYDYPIGSTVKIKKGEKEADYTVTGYMQSTNNSGQEMVISEAGISKLTDDDYNKSYDFEVEDGYELNDIFNKLNDKFDSRIISTSDFNEIIDGAKDMFTVVSIAIVSLISSICLFVILIVLVMLIKTLISKRKKEYGILKAVGYTSGNIIFQNAFSFMPTIILSTIIASIVSYFTINSFIGGIFSVFGVMKLNCTVPLNLYVLFGTSFVVISFIFAILLSRKVKKIEPIKLLTSE